MAASRFMADRESNYFFELRENRVEHLNCT